MTPSGRLLTAVSTFLFVTIAGASAAVADTPVSPDWPANDSGRSTLDTLLIYAGGTVGLFLLVALFGLLTARNNYVPPPPSQDLATTSDDVAHH